MAVSSGTLFSGGARSYWVFHDMRVLTASASCALEFDVCVGYGTPIARKRIDLSNGDDFDAAIDFKHDAKDVLEFRIFKSGDVSFEYKGARLLRL